MKAIKTPISFSNGKLVTTTDIEEIIKQKILDVLVTRPGERLMFPDYGADLYSLLYERLDPLVFADFKAEALLDIQDAVTGAKVLDITAAIGGLYAPEETTLNITVTYQIPPQRPTTMSFTIRELLTQETTV
jgi:phage baseplate assembly protein W